MIVFTRGRDASVRVPAEPRDHAPTVESSSPVIPLRSSPVRPGLKRTIRVVFPKWARYGHADQSVSRAPPNCRNTFEPVNRFFRFRHTVYGKPLYMTSTSSTENAISSLYLYRLSTLKLLQEESFLLHCMRLCCSSFLQLTELPRMIRLVPDTRGPHTRLRLVISCASHIARARGRNPLSDSYRGRGECQRYVRWSFLQTNRRRRRTFSLNVLSVWAVRRRTAKCSL